MTAAKSMLTYHKSAKASSQKKTMSPPRLNHYADSNEPATRGPEQKRTHFILCSRGKKASLKIALHHEIQIVSLK